MRLTNWRQWKAKEQATFISIVTILVIAASWQVQYLTTDLKIGSTMGIAYASQGEQARKLAEENEELRAAYGNDFSDFEFEGITPTVNDLQRWYQFKQSAKKLAAIYDYPANVLIAQAALESNRGTSKFARERHNYFGLGAYDANPNSAWHFENPEQAILKYLQVMKEDKRYRSAWAQRENPEAVIKAIKQAGFASDPQYIAKVTSIREWSEK